MEFINGIISFILNIDQHLGEIIRNYGVFTYAIIFLIVFSETGFVFIPFLPGDSLLFAAGAFAALGSLNIGLVILCLIVAAFLGDMLNYWIGYFCGQKIIDNKRFPLNQSHIDKTQKFYDKHGGKTIILARFIPIIRTFAPFVAGIGKMKYGQFLIFNIIGGVLWVLSFSLAGYFFGNITTVKSNFSLVIIVIIIISVIPILLEIFKAWKSKRK